MLFRDIVDLANCDGGKDGRTDMTIYRDAEAHLKRLSKHLNKILVDTPHFL